MDTRYFAYLALAAMLACTKGATAEPTFVPWRALSSEHGDLFSAAARTSEGWIAVGPQGRIAAIRGGDIAYYASPIRADWRSVWVAQTGEIFAAASTSSGTFVAVSTQDGAFRHWRLNQYGEVRQILGESARSVWLVRTGLLPTYWDGNTWQDVTELENPMYDQRLTRIGSRVILWNGKTAWQLSGSHIMRAPSLDGGQGVTKTNDTYLAVSPTRTGAVALLASGKEVLLTNRRTQVPHSTASGEPSTLDAPAIDECRGPSTTEPAEAETQPVEYLVPVVRRGVFTRGAQKFGIASRSSDPPAIEKFDGTDWKPFIGREILATWQGDPKAIGGSPASDELWIGGCGYVIAYARGRFTRHVLANKQCITGFYQGRKDAYFFRQNDVLSRDGAQWQSEPTPFVIRSMCEYEGKLFAVTNEAQHSRLLVRRDRGYFSEATSAGDLHSGLRGQEFGRVDSAAGAKADAYLLVSGRTEHFDGKHWTELLTDSGLGLRTIGYANGWFMGLGEDGFVYSRKPQAGGSHFVRGPYLNGERIFVESSTEASVATKTSIYHFDGLKWSAQPVTANGKKGSKAQLGVIGFARWQGRLLAFRAAASPLELDNGRWHPTDNSDAVSQWPRIPFADDDNANSQGENFKPCSVLQPRPDVLVLISCESNWVATLRGNSWTGYPLHEKLTATSTCIEGDGCYIFTEGSALRAEASAF